MEDGGVSIAVDVEARKQALRYFFTKVVEPMGFKFSPDEDMVDFLLEQEMQLEQEHGMPYCPCQGRSEDRAVDIQVVCPCIAFHRAHFDFMKRCWCGLFVHQDVTDPDSLPQIPESELLAAQAESAAGGGPGAEAPGPARGGER
jgi:ferredoxin-thioredoxin reductase catalytic subunit